MKLKTIKLEGELTGDEKKFTFQTQLGDIKLISNGRWEFAISAVTLFFNEGQAWNSIFELSTNYIDTIIQTPVGRELKEMTIGFIRVRGTAGEKTLLGYKWRDFFEVTKPSKTFKLNWTELKQPQAPQPTPAPKKSVYAHVLVLFRRVE